MCSFTSLVMHHESQFLNVSFLTKQIFGILRSQIKIEWVFGLVGVLKIPFPSEEHGLDYYCGEELT